MARSATITLDETDYKIFPFDIDQIERFTDAMTNVPKEKLGLFILRLALESAEPPVPATGKVRMTAEDATAAVPVILKLAGFQQTAANPQVAADKVAA